MYAKKGRSEQPSPSGLEPLTLWTQVKNYLIVGAFGLYSTLVSTVKARIRNNFLGATYRKFLSLLPYGEVEQRVIIGYFLSD
jgi:hypothetical protein